VRKRTDILEEALLLYMVMVLAAAVVMPMWMNL